MAPKSSTVNGKKTYYSERRSRKFKRRINRKKKSDCDGPVMEVANENVEYQLTSEEELICKKVNDEMAYDSKEKHVPKKESSSLLQGDRSTAVDDAKNDNFSFMFLLPLLWIISVVYAVIVFGKIFVKSRIPLANNEKNVKRSLHYLKTVRRRLRKNFLKVSHRKNSIKKRNSVKPKRTNDNTKNSEKLHKLIEGKVGGRRIVDFDHLWKSLRANLSNHGKDCFIDDWMLEKEGFFEGGLRSLFYFRCRKCHRQCQIWSEPTVGNIMGLNISSVLGSLHEGLGYTNVKGLFACMNIPYMGERTYKSNQEKLFVHLNEISAASIKAAGEEEARLAREAGHVTENGIPFITVIVDGSWIKRSFGTKYDSLSGVGAIIGKRTGKVLYVGVKNKYCTTCERAEHSNIQPRKHNCCRNYDRNKPSTLMETEALLEGFKESLNMHNIIYKHFVGDGDSSFYKNLLDTNPYAHLHIIPRKIECTNHLLRNFCKKAEIVAKTTQKKGARVKGFVALRSVVKNNILKMRQAVIDEVDRQVNDVTKPWNQKVQDLQKNLLNIPSHVFGEHKRCKMLNSSCLHPIENEKNYVPFLRAHGLYQGIEDDMKYLSCHAESLLHQTTNNIVESFNSIICKTVGGKRINFAASNQYNTRVAIAVLQHNSQEAAIDVYKGMGKNVPETLQDLISARKSKVLRTKQDRAVNGRKRKHMYRTVDKNYGSNCEKPDLSEEQMTIMRDAHLAALKEDQRNREKIEEETREQSNSDEWELKRKKLLTASNYGRICRMRPYTSCASMVKSILYPMVTDTVAMAYGRENEDISRTELSKIIKKDITRCGLFINPNDARFAASPDGLVEDDGVVELKNPARANDFTAMEAMTKYADLNFIDKKSNGIKKTHHWYYQIQGQLQATGREYGILALRTPKSIEFRITKRDDKFWKENMEPALSKFYDNCLLPEILDSRHARNMPIRDPTYIQDAKAKLKEKQDKKCSTNRQAKMEMDTAHLLCKAHPTENVNDVSSDDVIYISSDKGEHCWTKKDIESRRECYDTRELIVNAELVKKILNVDFWLSDYEVDAFINVVKMNTNIEIQSVLYITTPVVIEPAKTHESVAILGGNCTNHWRFIHFDGQLLHVCDTLRNYLGGKLVPEEMTYISKRFPQITEKDIIFPQMATLQPDCNSCGVYAAACLTYYVLKGDPSKVCFSKDSKIMRKHFVQILENKQLTNFPIISD